MIIRNGKNGVARIIELTESMYLIVLQFLEKYIITLEYNRVGFLKRFVREELDVKI